MLENTVEIPHVKKVICNGVEPQTTTNPMPQQHHTYSEGRIVLYNRNVQIVAPDAVLQFPAKFKF